MLNSLVLKMAEPEPEFVDEKWVANYIKKDVEYVNKIHLLDKLPFRYDKKGKMLYRASAVKARVIKYKLTPASTNHPLYEMSQAEVMVYLGINGSAHYLKHVREGHIKVHIGKNGNKCVYRKDADRFLRTYSYRYLMQFVKTPIVLKDAMQLLSIAKSTMKHAIRKGLLKVELRKPRERRRLGQATMMNYVNSHPGMKFRRRPIPKYISKALAEIYCGPVASAVSTLKVGIVKSEQYIDEKGKTQWGIDKDKLDNIIDAMWEGKCYSTDRVPYYTRKNIEYKFGKNKAWINTFIAGHCPLVNRYGEVVDPKGGGHQTGWRKADVEAIVASGVEYYPEIKLPKKIYKPEPHRYTKPPEKSHTTLPAVDAVEFALENAYTEREFAKEDHARKVIAERRAKEAEREVIRRELGYKPKESTRISRRNVIKYSEEREIIALVFNHHNKNIFKDRSLTKWDLAVFVHDKEFKVRNRTINNAITRLVQRGINELLRVVKMLPEWVILVPGTSIINDLNLHETLKAVPKDVMAVAPYGYTFRYFDGTWTSCTKTYGYYQTYKLDPPTNTFTFGTLGANGMHPVEVLDGPFVAVRGECLDKLREIHYFNRLGECRSALGPIISAICRRHHLKMMQIPVSSSECADYDIPVDSPKWHELEEVIKKYENATEAGISESRKTHDAKY